MSIPNETWWLLRITAGTHPEEVAFHKAALDDPEDPSTFAAWSDWCEEHGYLDTAEWLRDTESNDGAQMFYHQAHARREKERRDAEVRKAEEQLKQILREMDEQPGLDLPHLPDNRRVVMWKSSVAEVEKGGR